MPEFDQALSDSIAAAKSKLADREQAQRAAEAAEREKARTLEEKLVRFRGTAERFKNKHLEPLLRKLQTQLREAGFIFNGNYINHEEKSHGTVGSTLEIGERTSIEATIFYSHEKCRAAVTAQSPKGLCFNASQDFDEATSLTWFETNLAQAAGKLLETGEVPLANVVRYNGRIV